MPSYNHAAFVGEAIQSILDQSFQDFDIVVVDDGSRDGTPDVIAKFFDPRIKLEVFPGNKGGVIAGNSALQRASGKYVARLNSDDFFLPDKLEKQVAFLEANPDVAAVFGLPRLIDEGGKPLADGYREFTFPFLHSRPSREEWLRFFFLKGNCLCFPTVLIRRSIFDELGLLDPRLAALPDLDMWVRVCMKHEIYVMQTELTAYRKHHRALSARWPETSLRVQFEYFQILKHYRQLDPALAYKIFADDLAKSGIDTNRRFEIWFGEFALRAPPIAPRMLFGLDMIFEASSTPEECRRLIERTGNADVFNLMAIASTKISRNSLCPCGSGKRYKQCHGAKL
jgi:glycosyltransferase involved in cell wall biosynthesis